MARGLKFAASRDSFGEKYSIFGNILVRDYKYGAISRDCLILLLGLLIALSRGGVGSLDFTKAYTKILRIYTSETVLLRVSIFCMLHYSMDLYQMYSNFVPRVKTDPALGILFM